MNPSVLIFVALAVAWLAYLIPKALEHTEAAERTRAVVDFSHRLRVLGRREPSQVRRGRTEQAAKPAKPARAAERAEPAPAAAAEAPVATASPAVEPVAGGAAETYLSRSSYARAARRRRNVLATLGIVLFVCVVLAVFAAIPRLVVLGPVVLVAAWLVACRLMVRRERPAARTRPVTLASGSAAEDDSTGSVTLDPPAIGIEEDGRPEGAQAARSERVDESTMNGWDPVRVPLPTYVDKPAARRSVRTIDLDGTGVWSSGRNDSDSALAREADSARKGEPTEEVRRRSS